MIKFACDRMFWKIACIISWGLVAFVALYTVIILCADISTGEAITSPYTTSANVVEYTPTTVLMFQAPDGRTATIDFGGDKIIYSGDLPVDESAKLVFESFKHLCGENN